MYALGAFVWSSELRAEAWPEGHRHDGHGGSGGQSPGHATGKSEIFVCLGSGKAKHTLGRNYGSLSFQASSSLSKWFSQAAADMLKACPGHFAVRWIRRNLSKGASPWDNSNPKASAPELDQDEAPLIRSWEVFWFASTTGSPPRPGHPGTPLLVGVLLLTPLLLGSTSASTSGPAMKAQGARALLRCACSAPDRRLRRPQPSFRLDRALDSPQLISALLSLVLTRCSFAACA